MSTTLEEREISAPRAGRFKVHIQGNLKQSHFVVLTVHDLGCNHTMWKGFLAHESMEEVVRRSAFIHIDVPGQEDDAGNLPEEYPRRKDSGLSICYKFPSMQSLGEDLVCVLDQLDVKQVIGLGEGAGANIVARFAMAQPDRCLGVCLIHCTGTTAGFMESIKDKVISWKLDHVGMNPTAETYLVLHRFGSELFDKASSKDEINKTVNTFLDTLRSKINPHNLQRFVHSFMKRSNIADHLSSLKCRVLTVTGTKASFNHTVHTLFGHMTHQLAKNQVDLLEFDGVANVIEERPEKLAESFIYFAQGLGVMGGVPMPRVRRSSSTEQYLTKQRSMSMEECDRPTGIYSSSPSKLSVSPKSSPLSCSPPKN
ncbi:uncharacterized protein ZK1073.1-like isoform X1 [Mizuhopecten yessoensis]|uniref:uncharacterized protein ZK1073.1-like isoform X1 n=1 Tax=Mizuhopecten yessoensis TaxID=6573 RepID=UPI000B45CEEC|nr:uncharacterized protein ZK1073.1-like isoform X1 [Mizuhopecten yessoensis]